MAKLTRSLHASEPIPTVAKEQLDELLKSGDLFRYTAPSGEPSPVTLLEQEFADLLGSRFALAVNSCSSAIFLSLKALGLGTGDRVITPGFTFAAVPSAVVHAGCYPVLVEVGENYRLDMADFAAKLTSDIKAVVISHMRGHTSDMDEIQRLCSDLEIPIIEDAAHSLGTKWNGKNIGTIGAVGCFSFQSYKLVNGGEGGILITDSEDIIAQAVIMSGAYENNWQKHGCASNSFSRYQNQLPLYNMRMNNVSAVVIRPQLAEVAQRAAKGLRNHDYVADMLNSSAYLKVPPPLPPEQRAPDSIQFNLVDFSDAEAKRLMQACTAKGVGLSVFGLHGDNARVFWNWQFIPNLPELPKTRKMLMRAADVRLPAALEQADLDLVAAIILESVAEIKLPSHQASV